MINLFFVSWFFLINNSSCFSGDIQIWNIFSCAEEPVALLDDVIKDDGEDYDDHNDSKGDGKHNHKVLMNILDASKIKDFVENSC